MVRPPSDLACRAHDKARNIDAQTTGALQEAVACWPKGLSALTTAKPQGRCSPALAAAAAGHGPTDIRLIAVPAQSVANVEDARNITRSSRSPDGPKSREDRIAPHNGGRVPLPQLAARTPHRHSAPATATQ